MLSFSAPNHKNISEKSNDVYFSESSFNMTRRVGVKILRGGLPKLLDTRKGVSEKISRRLRKLVYFKTNRMGGLLKN